MPFVYIQSFESPSVKNIAPQEGVPKENVPPA